jgi:hypothetical protein
MNTSVKQKEKFWPDFIKACESQWKCGGERYALTEDKEFTDLVCESGGPGGDNWILQNIIKYCGELMNEGRLTGQYPEVDCFKIAVYSFLFWLKKRGQFTGRDKGEEFEK